MRSRNRTIQACFDLLRKIDENSNNSNFFHKPEAQSPGHIKMSRKAKQTNF